MKKRLKINGIIIFIALVLIALFPAFFLRLDRRPLLGCLSQIAGISLILLGQIFRASARGYKAELSKQGEKLLQAGPYSLVRNPMYLGILLIGSGTILMLFNWWLLAVFFAIFIIRYLFLAFTEEKKLLAQFQDEYRLYARKVPRIFPSPRIISSQEVADYLPLKSLWLKREIGTMLILLAGVLLAKSWKEIKSHGLNLYLREGIFVILVILVFSGLIVYLIRRTENSKSNDAAKG
jgi:protein-S-isoprenylcysteine O-methyltransferase Ste14